MTPDERLDKIEAILSQLLASDRYIFHKTIQIMDGRNLQLGTTTGTKIGTAATQKLGFFGHTPVVQQAAISVPSGGGSSDGDAVDLTGRTAIADISNRLKALGLTA